MSVHAAFLLSGASIRGQTCNLSDGFGQPCLLALRADCKAFGIDKFDVSHSEEAQKVTHIAGLRIQRRAGIEAPASGKTRIPSCGEAGPREPLSEYFERHAGRARL